MLKKVNTNSGIKSVEGSFPIYFTYTAGRAGSVFFQNLKNEGVLTGARCKKCGKVFLPPRIYCENCFEEIEEFVKLGSEGEIESWTLVKNDSYGNSLKEAVIVGVIKITGSDGRIIHKIRLKNGEKPLIGMKVVAKLKPPQERKGNMEDIEYFSPL